MHTSAHHGLAQLGLNSGFYKGVDVLDWNTPSIRFYRKLGATLRKEWILTRLTGPALRRVARTPRR